MKERGILFSAPMVRALLDGSKTQTRRALKVQPIGMAHAGRASLTKSMSRPAFYATWDESAADGSTCCICPYGVPGDRLWVRETWARTTVFPGTEMVVYREGDNRTDYGGPWKPGIHLFRRDSRITLEVTEVRVERLQDVSRGDAMGEGYPFPNMAQGDDPRQWYRDLWQSINGAESWEANLWVWVVAFKRLAA